jgi:hypothetical protein
MSEAPAVTLYERVASPQPDVLRAPLTERIRERPLLSLGVAGLIGFVMGGGAASRTGAATLLLVARIWLRRAASDALINVIAGNSLHNRRGLADWGGGPEAAPLQ